jgi:NADP-dependent 3-hydroxy acid dehydrogenase YdfG
MKTNVESKVILITGASSGIGEATARHLATKGHTVVLGARRTERLEMLAAEIRSAGGTAEYRGLDVTNLTDVQTFAEFALKNFGRIDVNIRGVLHGIAAVLPHMTARKSGHVINLSSIGGFQVWPTCAVYSGTKFAVRAISEGLRLETKDIRVTIIFPGVVQSELANTISDPATQAAMVEYRKVALTPDAIARAMAYAIEQPADVDVNEIVVRPTAGAQ